MKIYYLVLVFDEYMIPYVPYSQPKNEKRKKKKTYVFGKIMLSYLYIHLSLLVLF